MPTYLSTLSDASLRRFTTRASVAVAGALILAKLAAFFETGSVALLSSLVDSGVDLLASMITAYGVIHAARPPDKDHRFGHGKAEALAAIAQAMFIVGSSVLLAIEAIQRFVSPRALENEMSGYIVMGFAIVLTALLLLLQTYTIARTKSLAIASDRLHYVGDILINLAVIVTLYFQKKMDLVWIDPLFAIFIAGGMLYGAFAISKRALDVLMDAEMSERDRAAIMSLALAVEGVKGAHDLRTRFDSDKPFIEIHIELDPHTNLLEAQKKSESVSASIKAKYPLADVLIHQDPVGLQEERLDELIEKTE